MAKKRLRTSKLLLGVILLGMITMRLAWIENRAYPTYFGDIPWFSDSAAEPLVPISQLCGYAPALEVELSNLKEPLGTAGAFAFLCHIDLVFDPIPSEGWQEGSPLTESQLRRAAADINITLMILTALALGFSARLIGRSWLLASAIVAMLLSRGRWLSGLGQISDYYLWGLVLAFGLLAACVFFKTASRYPFIAIWLGTLILGFPLPEVHLVFCAFALVWLALYATPGGREVGPPVPIRLLGALPIGQAVAAHRRTLSILALAAAVGLVASLAFYAPRLAGVHLVHAWDLRVLGEWYQQWYAPIDIDIGIAMTAMVAALVLPRQRRYPLLQVTITLVVASLAFVSVASAWRALPKAVSELPTSFNIIANPNFIVPVFEPLLLMLGGLSLAIVGAALYHELRRRFASRTAAEPRKSEDVSTFQGDGISS